MHTVTWQKNARTLPISGRDSFYLRETVAEGSWREVFTTALLS